LGPSNLARILRHRFTPQLHLGKYHRISLFEVEVNWRQSL
jgi:hypothetical protein